MRGEGVVQPVIGCEYCGRRIIARKTARPQELCCQTAITFRSTANACHPTKRSNQFVAGFNDVTLTFYFIWPLAQNPASVGRSERGIRKSEKINRPSAGNVSTGSPASTTAKRVPSGNTSSKRSTVCNTQIVILPPVYPAPICFQLG